MVVAWVTAPSTTPPLLDGHEGFHEPAAGGAWEGRSQARDECSADRGQSDRRGELTAPTLYFGGLAWSAGKRQDASFTLYDDEGDTYNYEMGQYSTIQFTWSDSAKQLTIGARNGSYAGMPATRTFNIVWVGANHGAGLGVTATPDKVVNYNGSATVVMAN